MGKNKQPGNLLLLLKTRELARYLAGKTKNLDFVSPGYGVRA